MSSIYRRLQEFLDTIPNGFPAAPSGVEIRILEKIFSEEEAEITCDLLLRYETPDDMAARTGRDPEYLREKLREMQTKGQVWGIRLGTIELYRLMPFIFGIYEFQLDRMDRELAELFEAYGHEVFGDKFFGNNPPLLKVLPIEADIPHGSKIEPYESLKGLIEGAKSWAVGECICKKERGIMDRPCSKPTEVCLAFAPVPDYFETYFWGRAITKEEAYEILRKAEEAGLVHMTQNMKSGHFGICNCCSCCCGLLQGLNEMGHNEAIAHSAFYAVVDEEACTACGVCLDRCQAKAIDMADTAQVNKRCIGCGLCVSTCPVSAITMVRREESELPVVPSDEKDWYARREEARGGRGDYKKLL